MMTVEYLIQLARRKLDIVINQREAQERAGNLDGVLQCEEDAAIIRATIDKLTQIAN